MDHLPGMTEFRVEPSDAGVLHLVFDSPNRPMNVFSNKAIADLTAFSNWLSGSDAKGVVIRSGKASAFCAGADLNELGEAYDMIMAAPPKQRSRVAFDHFFPLSMGLRRLETAGKPVAAAIAGLALGGGGELALAAHYRVMVDDPKVAFGLPESLVGLLPGGGGTQRLPRLVGIGAALPILLDGARLSGQAAVAAGVVDECVAHGNEVAAAERWVLVNAGAKQPWDRSDWRTAEAGVVSSATKPVRAGVLATTLGHYPAPLAILDCIARGLPQPFDLAIRIEMEIFAQLIQRREPRNMIRTLFLGRLDHDRMRKTDGVGAQIEQAVVAVAARLDVDRDDTLNDACLQAGFGTPRSELQPHADDGVSRDAFWHETEPATAGKIKLRKKLADLDAVAAPWRQQLTEPQRRAADYMLVTQHGFPAYLGGVFAMGIN